MDPFSSYLFRKAYEEVEKLGDKLARIEPLIDWEAFTPIIQPLYDNQGPQGGRPNIDPVVMVKMLMLQAWYGLSDPELSPGSNSPFPVPLNMLPSTTRMAPALIPLSCERVKMMELSISKACFSPKHWVLLGLGLTLT